MSRRTWALSLRIGLLVLLIGSTIAAQNKAKPVKLAPAKLGSTINVHAYGATLLCGQPSKEEFAEAKQRGFKIVITLRQEGEIDWDEPGAIRALGMEFHRVPFRSPESLTDNVFQQARKLLKGRQEKPVLLHCGSANRVGAIWAAYRALDDGLSLEAAMSEARTVGLNSPAYEQITADYIRRLKRR